MKLEPPGPLRGAHAFCALLLAAIAPLRAACDAQAERPVPRAKGRIQQGPFLVLSQGTPGLQVMRGTEIVIHDAGIYCQGDAGYYPFDRMPEKQVELGPGTIEFHGGIPKAGVSYDQEVSIAGDRIRIRVRRNGDWQGAHWESFFFELPFANYRAARIRADDRVVRLPETYSEQHQTIVSSARRIECNLDAPSLDFVLECDRGMSVSDRRRWSDLKYLVAVPIPERAGEFTELYLTLPQMSEQDTWAVRYSPIGYPARGEKKVVLEWPAHVDRPDDDGVRLVRADGELIAQGRFGETVTLRHMQGAFAVFDFSDVTEPGDYRITWARGSLHFAIRQSVFEGRLWQPTLDCMIPFQMCHAEVDLGPDLPGHARCHMDDGVRVPANFPGTDGFRSYECEGTPYGAGDPIPCARGGWHDAGDCDLNIYAQGFSTLVLALAYEEFGLDRDVATVDTAAGGFRLGAPDGTPDLLQQIEWGTVWLLSMMQPDGRSFVGVVAQPNRRNHAGGWDESTDNEPGTGDERHVYVDHHSELQLMQAQALCAAHRALERHRPELAARCLSAARRAYEYFRTHDEVYRPTAYFYDKHVGSRDQGVVGALAELWLTTKDPAYLHDLEAMTDRIAGMSVDYPDKQESGASSFWFAGPALARLVPLLDDGALRAACLSTCRRAARHQAQLLAGRPWAGHYTDFGKLGSADRWPTRVFDVYWMSKVAPDVVSLDAAVMPMLWLYGFHPFSEVSYYAADGLDGPRHIHCGHLTYLFRPERGTMPGVLVPGMTAVRPYVPDNVLYDFDDGNVANREYTIAGLALYLFAVPAMQRAGY